ncbi:leucine-rich repeat protein [Tanacetum coccineum]
MKSPQAVIYLSSSSLISFLFYGLVITCLTFATTFASHGGNETDYHALLSFKSTITHDPDKILTSWNDSFHFYDWSGISCGKWHKQVITLRLGSQGLEGSLSPHVGNLSFLRELYLRNNSFQGTIPHELGRLSRLRGILSFLGNITSMEVFSCVENPLGGSIPDTLVFLQKVGNQLPNLENLWLRDNELTGVLSPSISNCSKLRYLEMANNEFSGKLTIDFSKLRDIDTIRLQCNNFHGRREADDMRFIDSLKNCTTLVELELQNCNLTGVLPVLIGNLSDQLSILGFVVGVVTLELPKCKEKGSHKRRFPFFILVTVIAPTLLLLIVLCCVYLFLKKIVKSHPSQSLGNENERFLKVSYNQLFKATDGFSKTNLIGEGRFSFVYKGILNSNDDKFVAVKVLHLQNRGPTKFMPNGSVHDWLHSSTISSKLNILQRINILRDVAAALDYLHIRCQTTILHCDLKPSNILLDDDMVAHVGDFGLARLLGTDSNQNNSTRVKGTIGYAPLEYGMGSEMTSNHVVDVIDGDAVGLW